MSHVGAQRKGRPLFEPSCAASRVSNERQRWSVPAAPAARVRQIKRLRSFSNVRHLFARAAAQQIKRNVGAQLGKRESARPLTRRAAESEQSARSGRRKRGPTAFPAARHSIERAQRSKKAGRSGTHFLRTRCAPLSIEPSLHFYFTTTDSVLIHD
jgi:hypothetical protein